MTASDLSAVLARIQSDERYLANLDWGQPRHGHPEGTVRAHIAELERNLYRLCQRLGDEEIVKLQILIHVHDTFKAEAKRGVAIADPRSHASLARAFLAEFIDDDDLLAMVQWHDEPYALYLQFRRSGGANAARFDRLLAAIDDWNLFTAFLVVDGCTEGKDRGPLVWLFREIAGQVESEFGAQDVL